MDAVVGLAGVFASFEKLEAIRDVLGSCENVTVSAVGDDNAQERESFLAEPHVAALSVSAGAGRGPLTLPIWYQYSPGGEAWVLTGANSRKAQLISRAGRFTLLVERVLPTVRYASVEGPVARMEPGTDDMLWEIARRYLPETNVQAYVDLATSSFGEQVAIFLRPERWSFADLGPGVLPPGYKGG